MKLSETPKLHDFTYGSKLFSLQPMMTTKEAAMDLCHLRIGQNATLLTIEDASEHAEICDWLDNIGANGSFWMALKVHDLQNEKRFTEWGYCQSGTLQHRKNRPFFKQKDSAHLLPDQSFHRCGNKKLQLVEIFQKRAESAWFLKSCRMSPLRPVCGRLEPVTLNPAPSANLLVNPCTFANLSLSLSLCLNGFSTMAQISHC